MHGKTRLALALASCLAQGCSEHAATPAKPNIILIVADTLRADYLGYRGFVGGISPALDQLASESVQFSRCFAQAPWTKPSIASLFTSLDPLQHGMTDANDAGRTFPQGPRRLQRLSEEALTLAEALHGAGYTTAARVSNPWIREINGFAQGFEDWTEEKDGGTGSAEEIIDAMRALSRREPFFLYLHFMGAHGPYGARTPGSEELARLRRSPSLGRNATVTPEQERRRPAYLGESLSFSTPDAARVLRNWKAAYALGVLGTDREIGKIIEWARSSRLLDDTLLVFTSDHGEEFLEHGEWEHGRTLCNHQLHVPLLIRLPGARRAGTVHEGLVRLTDLMPTLLARAGGARPAASSEGTDLSPILDGLKPTPQSHAFATGKKGDPNLLTIQDGRYKLLADIARQEFEIFDLALDPEESRPLDDVPPPVAASLRQALQARAERRPTGTRAEVISAELLDEEVEALRALGYVE